jgi:CDP-diacylglycerol--glycerol-3-phosphate 3-phosphatidyltransferase
MNVRERWRRRVEPIAAGFGRLGLTPNALTLIGFGIALVAAWFASERAWLAAGLAVVIGAVFDLFDGALARATGQASKFGAFLDSTMDRWGEAVVYVGLIIGLQEVGYTLGPPVAAAAMVAAFMVSYARAKSESLGFTPGRGMASIGLAPREVRIVILTIGLLAAGILGAAEPGRGQFPGAATYTMSWLVLVGSLALITVLATITTIQRIVHVYREASKQENQ